MSKSEDTIPKATYDAFMGVLSEVCYKIEDFCTSMENNPSSLTPEQAKGVQTQINKLREAMDILAARFKDVR